MGKKSKRYKFKSDVWIYPGDTPWHFASVPKELSAQIKDTFGAQAKGWGSIPVRVTVGKTSWDTSIFPDNKSGMYLLPIKALVRQKENIKAKDEVVFVFEIRL